MRVEQQQQVLLFAFLLLCSGSFRRRRRLPPSLDFSPRAQCFVLLLPSSSRSNDDDENNYNTAKTTKRRKKTSSESSSLIARVCAACYIRALKGKSLFFYNVDNGFPRWEIPNRCSADPMTDLRDFASSIAWKNIIVSPSPKRLCAL